MKPLIIGLCFLLGACVTPKQPAAPEGHTRVDLTECGPVEIIMEKSASFGEVVVGAGFHGVGKRALAQLHYSPNSNWSITVMDTETGHACFVLTGLGWRWFKPPEGNAKDAVAEIPMVQ